jgi:microcin C transport system substrate-binding protein
MQWAEVPHQKVKAGGDHGAPIVRVKFVASRKIARSTALRVYLPLVTFCFSPWTCSMNFRPIATVTSLAAVACVFVFLVTGCGKKAGSTSPGSEPIVNTWNKVKMTTTADPSVPAELGGDGFEKIAADSGFQTAELTSDQLKWFGDSRAVTGGKLSMTISRYPLSFRPFFFGPNANFTENYIMSALCYQTLVGLHPVSLEYVPSLATHWKISPDLQTFTFRIDPKARFWDGKPVTARDVIATFDLVMDATLLSPSMQQQYEQYDRPVALSKYIVQVHSRERNWRSFQTFGVGLNILQADQIEKMDGREFTNEFMMRQPIGSGEYILLEKDITNQKRYVYTRRPDYWRAEYPTDKYAGNFDRIAFTTIPDNPNAEYETFLKGASDIFYYTSTTIEKWVRDSKEAAFQNNHFEKFRIRTDGAAGAAGIYFNARKAPFNDIRVRKAFYYLFDRKSIINKLFYDEYVPYNSFYSNGVYENKANEVFDYNPGKAAQLLAEAGYTTRNSDGFLTKAGRPLTVEMSITAQIEKYMTLYQQTLKQAGINLILKFENANSITKNIAERNFRMVWVNYGGLTFPNPESSYSSKLADKNDNNNITGFKNTRMDQIIEEYKLAFDQKDRVRLIQEADGLLWQDCIAALAWNTRGIKLGVWQKFGFPEYMLSRQTQAGDHDLAIMSLWWFDKQKADKLQQAKESKSKLDGTGKINEVAFWKNRSF